MRTFVTPTVVIALLSLAGTASGQAVPPEASEVTTVVTDYEFGPSGSGFPRSREVIVSLADASGNILRRLEEFDTGLNGVVDRRMVARSISSR